MYLYILQKKKQMVLGERRIGHGELQCLILLSSRDKLLPEVSGAFLPLPIDKTFPLDQAYMGEQGQIQLLSRQLLKLLVTLCVT